MSDGGCLIWDLGISVFLRRLYPKLAEVMIEMFPLEDRPFIGCKTTKECMRLFRAGLGTAFQ